MPSIANFGLGASSQSSKTFLRCQKCEPWWLTTWTFAGILNFAWRTSYNRAPIKNTPQISQFGVSGEHACNCHEFRINLFLHSPILYVHREISCFLLSYNQVKIQYNNVNKTNKHAQDANLSHIDCTHAHALLKLQIGLSLLLDCSSVSAESFHTNDVCRNWNLFQSRNSEQSPEHLQSSVHSSPNCLHLHLVLHTLHPHLMSSWHAFDASGMIIHTGETFSFVIFQPQSQAGGNIRSLTNDWPQTNLEKNQTNICTCNL